jgi:hypothetical protein
VTRLRSWLAANTVVLAGAATTGITVGRAHGLLAGIAAAVVFGAAGIAALAVAIVWRGRRG